jgi:hypothetical protein
MGFSLQQFPVRNGAEVNGAPQAMVRSRVDGVVALSNLVIMLQRGAIADFAARYRIPTISGWEDFAVDGIPAGHQHEDRKGARAYHPAFSALPRRPGRRMIDAGSLVEWHESTPQRVRSHP